MIITSFYRITKTAFISLWRNQWLSLAATLVMVLTLITISFFISLLIVTNKTTDTLREKADMTVYFNDEATNDQIFAGTHKSYISNSYRNMVRRGFNLKENSKIIAVVINQLKQF